MKAVSEIDIRKATLSEIDSLTSIIPRSFNEDALLNRLFSATPVMKQWWTEVYTQAIASPACHILVALDADLVVGVLTLHLWREGATAGGICTLVPLTSDHYKDMRQPLLEQAEQRLQMTEGKPNLMIDLMAVDQGYQCLGIGKRLVIEACEIADREGVMMFLETTQARRYYLKLGLGFESRDAEDEGGCLIRQAKGSTVV